MAAWSLSRISVAAILAWLGLLFYVSTSLVRVQTPPRDTSAGSEDAAEALRRIARATEDLEDLRRKNNDLRRLLASTAQDGSSAAGATALAHQSREHEVLRRRLRSGVWEMWYSTRGKLKALLASAKEPALKDRLTLALGELTEQWQSLAADAEALGGVDGAADWRRGQLANLSAAVQAEIGRLQSPADCGAARKLLCQLNKGCGFGCQIHHAAYCAVVAYATQRTLILDTNGWRYSSKGWKSVFLDVSPTCEGADVSNAVQWKGPDVHANDRVVSLPIVDSLRPSPAFLPLSFPAELSEQLMHLHGNPPVWWIGQFVAYLMRWSPEFESFLKRRRTEIGFSGPIVGLHVRRTDKLGSEAQFHSLQEYMEWAEMWVARRSLRLGEPVPKRAFLATDDKDLLSQARAQYPSWSIVGSADVAASAQLSSRYSDSSLRGVLQDIHFLAEADHLVCTFSSQVCRVAYELAQVRRGDVADAFDSLDDLFYFGGQHGHEVVARLPHSPPAAGAPSLSSAAQLAMRAGDVIGIAGNHWDGWSKGRNTRTAELGLFPSWKVREKWRVVPFRKP